MKAIFLKQEHKNQLQTIYYDFVSTFKKNKRRLN